MAENTVAYDGLTPKAQLLLKDLIGVADENGILYSATLEKLQIFTTSLSDIAFKGGLAIGETPVKGWYFATETGNYVIGGTTIAVDITNTLTIIIVPDVLADSYKLEIPIDLSGYVNFSDVKQVFNPNDDVNPSTMKSVADYSTSETEKKLQKGVLETDFSDLADKSGYIRPDGSTASGDSNFWRSSFIDAENADVFNVRTYMSRAAASLTFYNSFLKVVKNYSPDSTGLHEFEAIKPAGVEFYKITINNTENYHPEVVPYVRITKKVSETTDNYNENIQKLETLLDEDNEFSLETVDFNTIASTGSDLSGTYYANSEIFTTKKSVLKEIRVKSNGTGILKVNVYRPTNNSTGVELLHRYDIVDLIDGDNTYSIDDDFVIPKNCYVACKSANLYYVDDSSNSTSSLRFTNDKIITSVNRRVSFEATFTPFKVPDDIKGLSGLDSLFDKKYDAFNNRFLRKKEILPTDKIILYGTSIFSDNYPWNKSALEGLTGATVNNAGFSGNSSAQLASDAKLQTIFDYGAEYIVAMTGGNDDGAYGTVGTFTKGLNGLEPVVTETDVDVDYNGTYFIQAVDHMIRKIKKEYYNIRERANLTGAETEAEKEAKIDAVLKPKLVFCTPLPQQRTDALSEYSLPENWQRKRIAVIEACMKNNVQCIDFLNSIDLDMSIEPFFTTPTDTETNNGVYFMDGLHPNKYLYQIMMETVYSQI